MAWTAPDADRPPELTVGPEIEVMLRALDEQRQTLLFKCGGLTGEQLVRRGAVPSNLSLLGLIRHLTDAERFWFRRTFLGEPVPEAHARADCPDAAFTEAIAVNAEADYANLLTEMQLAREAVAEASLTDVVHRSELGALSLRWIFIHMIAEYARHNGHADLLREGVDGATGE